mmetsp:Transcript_5603/g.12325  ORF Transcript_5603/g.12325 Transcript_5603/m.12325 type:complete len:230 (+) Transcript_5603:64-753(+)|eukprot:CAMPEP_0175848066 /NCGR_PEP_ID=MMETSP0107_2-20121207/23711_1 /TAXON_ID=195067 ORGANISM="Goniomonas pacifica, Strain CCMP1869" /NCGR_SAMPLE_ID=MMETSP0107_2 /ASSEMBLY_ACC=CAM_ASM_000203 /LENGTH=229 /DNA_ID=CAMNT_0017162969 /DNA_START=64 /DNA_END=753 /DNA_ORIENTATION=-
MSALEEGRYGSLNVHQQESGTNSRRGFTLLAVAALSLVVAGCVLTWATPDEPLTLEQETLRLQSLIFNDDRVYDPNTGRIKFPKGYDLQYTGYQVTPTSNKTHMANETTHADLVTDYFNAKLKDLQAKIGSYMGKVNTSTIAQTVAIKTAASTAQSGQMAAAQAFAKDVEGLYKSDSALDTGYSKVAGKGATKKLNKFKHELGEGAASRQEIAWSLCLGALALSLAAFT